MSLKCPDCDHEILKYLKAGELKKVTPDFMISFQLFFCINCKTVFYEEHERFKLKPLKRKEFFKDGTCN
jgi:uncharacterized protein with PIN domain